MTSTILSPHVALSTIDTERFGVRTARAALVASDTLGEVLDFCCGNAVQLLIARCATSELHTAQEMERAGFLIMDSLIYFTRDLVKHPIPTDTGKATIRPIRPGDEVEIEPVAAAAFSSYAGHYHADKRLDREKCNATYISWAVRSCTIPGVADEVLVAELNGKIVGFATLRLNSASEGDGVLFGVDPAAQGLGIYRSFVIRGMEWSRAQGASHMVISTQITNLAVQKVWTRLGFEPSRSYYTFHKWFDSI